jgi:hypoxanthine phosphoribosyltransferase
LSRIGDRLEPVTDAVVPLALAGESQAPPDERIGEVYLSAEEIATRVGELGAQIAADYEGREPLLVASLKASFVFLADLTRAIPILHHIDFVELAGYTSDETGGTQAIRFLKDLDAPLEGRDVVIVEDVVDTGLTLNYLVRTFTLRSPRSLAAVTLLDRPYRRLVDDLPVRYVGFTVPDEFFVGYGFDVQERYRNLPDLHILNTDYR